MTVTQLKQRATLAQFAQALGCSERWLKYRVAEGMPSEIIAGRRKVVPPEAEKWLEKEGHIVKGSR